MYKAEQAPSLGIEMGLLASPARILCYQCFSGIDYVSWYFGNKGCFTIFQVFLSLSFHLPVSALQSSVLLMTDFIIFVISNPLLVPIEA